MTFLEGLGRIFLGQTIIWAGLYWGWWNTNHMGEMAFGTGVLALVCLFLSIWERDV